MASPFFYYKIQNVASNTCIPFFYQRIDILKQEKHHGTNSRRNERRRG